MLTDRQIRTAQPREKEYELRDVGNYGGGNLYCRIRTTGTRVFRFVMYVSGRHRKKTLGQYPELSLADARVMATNLSAEWQRESSAPPSTQCIRTVSECFEDYMRLWAVPRKKSAKTDAARYNRHLREVSGLNITEVDFRRISAILDAVVSRGSPIEANRLYALLSKFFSFSLERGWVDINPMDRLQKPSKEKAKIRFLSSQEIRILWGYTESSLLGQVLRVVLLTAQRPGEVRQMKWREITGDWWEIPASVAKNERAHRVYLSGFVRSLLPERHASSEYVFPSFDGLPFRLDSPGHFAARVSKQEGFISTFTAHDLRRTGLTHMGSMGVPEYLLGVIANHANKSITGIYNRYGYDKEKQEALEAWGERVRKWVTSMPD